MQISNTAIYRSLEKGFNPVGTEPYSTLTENSFTDANVSKGQTYYYRLSAIDFAGNESPFTNEMSVLVTSVELTRLQVPDEFVLEQNYPNPFNPTTVIRFGLPAPEVVTIHIYNLNGALVRTLVDSRFAAGYHEVAWDGRDEAGQVVSGGIYVYKMQSPSGSFIKKMTFIK